MNNDLSNDSFNFEFDTDSFDLVLDDKSFESKDFIFDEANIFDDNSQDNNTSNDQKNGEFLFIETDKESNDIFLNSNDAFDIGNLNFNNYNIDIINTEKPSENKKKLENMNAIGNKKSYNEIEYKNETYLNKDEKHQELSKNNNEKNSEASFYELEIEDYPYRDNSLHSIDINNKSLGADDKSGFISKIINGIRNIIAKNKRRN